MPSGKMIDLATMPGAYHLPRPNWDVIRDWINQHVPESDRGPAWEEAASQWLATLNNALGDAYQIERSENLLLFAPRGEGAGNLLDFGESALTAVSDMLGDIAGEAWAGPLVVLNFASPAAYYEYLEHFYPEGEFGGSGGSCVRGTGHIHIALSAAHPNDLERCLAHEIAHACLSHLTLPLWLEEGITQHAEGVADSRMWSLPDPDRAAATRKFWHEHGLAPFWWGDGFFAPSEEQGCSYMLSRVLYHLLAVDHRRAMSTFVRAARREDAGESAAREHLGRGLADLAAKFLGAGEWEPTPPDAERFLERGTLRAARGQVDLALADLEAAARLAPGKSAVHLRLGDMRARLGQFGPALADYERAIELALRDHVPRNNQAWLLATCPADEYRDGERALRRAGEACELAAYGPWYCLGTMAAASAEVGDFEEAVRWAKESMRRAPERQRDGCRVRLQMYKQGVPYRDVPGGAEAASPAETSPK